MADPATAGAPDLRSNLPLRPFVDGKPIDGSSGKRSPLVYPGNEEVIGEISEGSAADVDAAVKAARRELEPGSAWQKMGPIDRQRILYRIADAMRTRADEIARLETLNTGKPIAESKMVDVGEAINVFEYFAGWATKVHGQTLPDRPGAFIYTRREPVGVVGAITPWNFPLDLAVWKVAPAIAAGCCIVLKPASITPCSILKVAEIAVECGLPPGVFSVVPGAGSTVGSALIRHPGVEKIAFTGSTENGKWVAKECAELVKRCTLELGGKSPNVVLADADLEAAARGATIGIFYNKGEVCAAGSRLLVEDAAHDAFMDKLLARTAKMVPGDPFHPKTRLGPVVLDPEVGRPRLRLDPRHLDLEGGAAAELVQQRIEVTADQAHLGHLAAGQRVAAHPLDGGVRVRVQPQPAEIPERHLRGRGRQRAQPLELDQNVLHRPL